MPVCAERVNFCAVGMCSTQRNATWIGRHGVIVAGDRDAWRSWIEGCSLEPHGVKVILRGRKHDKSYRLSDLVSRYCDVTRQKIRVYSVTHSRLSVAQFRGGALIKG